MDGKLKKQFEEKFVASSGALVPNAKRHYDYQYWDGDIMPKEVVKWIDENFISKASVPAETLVRQGRSLPDVACGWISVKDKLPTKATWSGDRVLVYTEEGYIHTGLYEGEEAEEWYDKFNDSGYITHWMALPSKPSA
jgi:hypothetical protein